MKNKIKPFVYLAAGIFIGVLTVVGVSFKEVDKNEEKVSVKEDGRLMYDWYAPQVPKSISFAGEKVPLERWDVKEQLDREILYNYYNHYSTLYILKLSQRYFPMIERRLKAHGVPEDFKYLCVAESALRNQVSPAGAAGFWQFMSGTAPSYGLEVNGEVDERYHVEKATDAACQYLKQAYSKFGSWTAAAASYNCGMGGYNKFSDYQGTEYYYDLLLPEETMRYIFRIVAFKHLIGEAEKVGFKVLPSDAYFPVATRKIPVTSTIPNLAAFAQEHGSNYRMLKLLNPWLRDHSLTVKNNTYVIELPAE